jgi:hypothetical protein
MNSVLLAAPLIVFALVLLLGFTGCWLDTRGKPGPPNGTDGDGNGNGNGETPPVPDPYVDEVKSLNPIAYWRLSDPLGSTEAKDEIGAPPSGDHPGAVEGTVTFGQAPGLNLSDPNATSAQFDGTGHVEVAQDQAFETPQFTVEAHVHPDSVVSRGVVVGTMSSSLIVSGGWALAIVPRSATDDPDIDGHFAPVISDGSGPPGGPPPVAFDFAKLGTAWHLAITYDGTVFTFYWDGVKVDWGTWPYAPTTQEPIQIGSDFKGAIQEVAVYGAALTAEQIGTHYLANTSPGP